MVFHDICLVNNYAPLENKAPQDEQKSTIVTAS